MGVFCSGEDTSSCGLGEEPKSASDVWQRIDRTAYIFDGEHACDRLTAYVAVSCQGSEKFGRLSCIQYVELPDVVRVVHGVRLAISNLEVSA